MNLLKLSRIVLIIRCSYVSTITASCMALAFITNEAQKLDRASGSSLVSPARSSARRPFRAWSSSSKLVGMWTGLTKVQARSSAMRASELHFGRKFWEFWLLWLKFFLKIRMLINNQTLNLMWASVYFKKKIRFLFKIRIKSNYLDLIPNIAQGQARKLSSCSGGELQAQARFFVISSPARISSSSKLGVPELMCIIIQNNWSELKFNQLFGIWYLVYYILGHLVLQRMQIFLLICRIFLYSLL